MDETTIRLPARNDADHTTSISGGLRIYRRPETLAGTPSRMELEQVNLKASSLFGLTYTTEELLDAAPRALAELLAVGFQDELGGALLNEKLYGLGGDQYLGVVGADCTIVETRDTSSRIVGDDVIQMRARCWGYGQAIWLANPATYPELQRVGAAAYDTQAATPLTGSNDLYQHARAGEEADTLAGRPIFYSEYAKALGTKGDLVLGNWSQFLEGTYQPVRSAESIHVRFVNHERAFKFWLRNAGAPWWRVPLTPKNGTNTLSPFVVLDA
jgi:HK97 family phage major capsid protein